MPKAIEYLSQARGDFDESFDWYCDRSPGAAIGFAAAVDEALGRIVADPGRFPSTFGACSYCPLQRYPFRLVFREEADRIVVVAVAHAKRRPDYWHSRT